MFFGLGFLFLLFSYVLYRTMSLNVLRRKLGALVGGSGGFGSVSGNSIELAQARLFSSSALACSNYKVRGLLPVEYAWYIVSRFGI